MKTIQLIIIALLVSSFCGAQTTYSSNKAIITGKILVSPNDTLIITYYPYKFGNAQVGGIVTKHANNDGSFRLEIANMEHPYYFSIGSVKERGILLDDHLLEPGDSLMITSNIQIIENDKNPNKPLFNITGHNADKNQLINIFNFAYRRFKISGLTVSIINKYTNLREALPVLQKNSERYKQYWDSLQTANHFSIPNSTKAHLLRDLEIRNITGLLNVYSHLFEKYTGKEVSTTALQELQTDYKETVIPLINKLMQNYDYVTISPDFADMAVRKILIDTRIEHSGEKVISSIKYLDALQLWTNPLREFVITGLMAVTYTYTVSIKDTWEIFPALDTLVRKPALKSLIQDFRKLYTRGQSVAPFFLTGKNNEIISISDYKDKVVVLDFWFTGCRGCMILAHSLKIAKKRLADDTDIVFISVSIDKDKNTWLKSVSEEKYTHADFINTYTGGDGMDHPLIKRYSITAYPRLMIIGKNNKLATANPHIPNSLEEVDILVQNIIDAKE